MFLLSLFGTLFLMIFWNNLTLIPFFITMAKFGVSATFNMVFIAFMQLIPTLYTATIFGISNVVARTVTIMSPLIAEMDYPTPLILEIIAVLFACFISQLVVVKLPKFI